MTRQPPTGDDLPEPVRRQLAAASRAEPPIDLLDAVIDGVHATSQLPPWLSIPRVVVGLGGVAAIVAVALIIRDGAAPTTVGSLPVKNVVQKDGFVLELGVGKAEYRANEPITASATLTYTGPDGSIVISGSSIVVFSEVDIGGTRDIIGASHEVCQKRTLKRNEPTRYPFVKSGGWAADDPNAAFYAAFFDDNRFLLPQGTWEIQAAAEFTRGGDCSAHPVRMLASARIVVHPVSESLSPASSLAPSVPPGRTVLTARDVVPLGWSPDGAQFAALEVNLNEPSILHVLAANGREVWSHAGQSAAWVGADALAILAADPRDLTHSKLSIVKISSGEATALPGTYLNFMIASSSGRLAVAVGDTDVTGFALQNPAGPTQSGEPLAWDPTGTRLAIGRWTTGGIRGPDLLAFLNVATGELDQTDFRISRYGVTFDRSGRNMLACVYYVDLGGDCNPTQIEVASRSAIRSPGILGELLNPGELPDGRWVGWNALAGTNAWDPAHTEPGHLGVALGSARPAVSSAGVVAMVDWLDSTSPAIAPDASGAHVSIIHLVGPTTYYPMWSPKDDRLAYIASVNGHVELRFTEVRAPD